MVKKKTKEEKRKDGVRILSVHTDLLASKQPKPTDLAQKLGQHGLNSITYKRSAYAKGDAAYASGREWSWRKKLGVYIDEKSGSRRREAGVKRRGVDVERYTTNRKSLQPR
jgi:hypothetical protein